jgi:aryl-alcohol dehydrogenase-like predicted oxidoreductase
MQYNQLGNSDLQVSKIGLGALHHGVYLGLKESEKLINRALDLGINFIETAPIYGKGCSESFIGTAIRQKRSQIIISTKVGLKATSSPDGDFGVEVQALTKKHVKESAEHSLTSLRSDYIDLLQLHAFDPTTALEETIEALEELCQEGKIRYFGCSNYSPEELEVLLTCESSYFISCQAHYNIFERMVEKELLPICSSNELGVICNRVLARGILSSKYLKGCIPKNSRAAQSNRIRKLLDPDVLEMVKVLQDWAKEKQITVTQCGLAWTMSQSSVNCALIGVRNEEQLRECVQAIDIELPLTEWQEIEQIFEDKHWLSRILHTPRVYLEK